MRNGPDVFRGPLGGSLLIRYRTRHRVCCTSNTVIISLYIKSK